MFHSQKVKLWVFSQNQSKIYLNLKQLIYLEFRKS